MKPRDQFGLDALLGRWPAQDPQEKGGPSWEERAEKIVGAALALKSAGSPDTIAALTAPPPLDAEPGEEKAASFQLFDDGASRPRAGGETQPMSSDQPKKPSLKELAARASQTGAAKASVTPLPPAMRSSAPPPERSSTPPVPATVTPIAKARAARQSDAGREDSGVLKLADLQAKEAQRAEAAAAAAEAALKSAQSKRADDQKAAVAAKPAPAPVKGGSSGGMWAGAAIAVLGIAAAFAVYRSQKHEAPPTASTTAPAAPTQVVAAATEAPKAPVAPPTEVASAEPAPAVSGAPKTEVAKTDDAKGADSAEPEAPAPAVTVASSDVKPAASGKPLVGSKVGSLDEEMKKAVGQKELDAAPQDDGSKPASGGGGNVPEQPSQGSAQAAVRAVLPAAKACVAGATDVTSGSITFASSGSVQSVSVGGWAAANGKAACVKSALQGAHVSPFAKPTFTVPVNIRP